MTATRLPAAQRRQAIVAAGLQVFSTGSYSGATTAEIARAAGISEPILYRHFDSKRDLYFACLEEAWQRLREVFEARIGEFGDGNAFEAIAQTDRSLRVLTPNLWIQALTEAGEDPAIARFLRGHMRDVHDYIAGVARHAQAAGFMAADRDPDAEAWIYIAGGLLVSVADRLGGLLDEDDLARIVAQRLRWLTGSG